MASESHCSECGTGLVQGYCPTCDWGACPHCGSDDLQDTPNGDHCVECGVAVDEYENSDE
jgi:hypothetical protein